MIFRAKVVWFSEAEGQMHMTYQTLWNYRSHQQVVEAKSARGMCYTLIQTLIT